MFVRHRVGAFGRRIAMQGDVTGIGFGAACVRSGVRHQWTGSNLGSARLDKSKDTTMARRLALGYALIATVWCAQAFALGLGDITIHSALNQKLDAEIELLETRGMTESEIVAQLASSDDFKRVGIERFFFLTSLQFHVEMRDQGRAVLRVSSAQPMTEPYLNFLVQVIWPNGRLLKEYTVLLDPPTYKEQPAPAVASPGRSDKGGGPAGRVERTPTRPDSQVSLSSAPRSTQPATRPQLPSDRLSGDSYGVTDRDDTLWKIAQRTRPSENVTVQQSMLAITRMNPEAFIGGNINLLKAGYTLRLPKEADIQAISNAEALSEVASQNQAWQAYRRGEGLASVAPTSTPPTDANQALAGQVDATAKKSVAVAPQGPDGELRIVAGDASDHGSGGGNADTAALEGQLAAAKEEADRLALERDDAVARLDKATSQAEQTQRQIEVRDQQIAQMQEQLKAAKSAAAAAPAPAKKQEGGGGIAALLASPFVLAGAAIVLVLIVVAGMMRARSRRRDHEEMTAFEEVEPARSTASRMHPRLDEMDDQDIEPEAPALRQEEEHETAPHHEGAQTSDVIGEADIYIAYGRYPQAVSLLLGALDDDPNRSDVRVKLLEVYAETKDESGFETHMSELLTRCDDNELLLEARELEAKLRENAPAAAVAATEDDAVAGNLDDFQLDLDADEADEDDGAPTTRTNVSSERVERASDDLGGDLGIDFKADDEPTMLRTHTSSARVKQELGDVAVAADEGDDFDLEDLEFEPAARNDAKLRAGSGEETDDAFEFLNEEDAATTKLDLARAYIDMGDEDGAREILTEVLQEGSSEQQQTANELRAKPG